MQDKHKIDPAFKVASELASEHYIRLPSANRKSILMANPNYGYITPEECTRRLDRMNREFNKVLTEQGYALSREDFKKLDCIDMRNVFNEIGYMTSYLGKDTGLPNIHNHKSLNPKLAKLMITDDPFVIVPCFEKGCIQLNRNRWLYWEITELIVDGDEPHVTIKLQDYIDGSMQGSRSWTPGLYTIITSSLKTTDDINIIEYNTFKTLYESMDYSQFHWSEDDMYIWNRYTIKHATTILEEDVARNKKPGEAQAEILMAYYVVCVTAINSMLANSKVSRGKKPKTAASASNRKVKTEYTPKDAPKRLVRTIGYEGNEIAITSEKTPRLPSEEYVRHYSVASWKVRGTVRHYTNGKTVYIKEHVRHRHALKDTESEVTPTTIRVSRNADILKSDKT